MVTEDLCPHSLTYLHRRWGFPAACCQFFCFKKIESINCNRADVQRLNQERFPHSPLTEERGCGSCMQRAPLTHTLVLRYEWFRRSYSALQWPVIRVLLCVWCINGNGTTVQRNIHANVCVEWWEEAAAALPEHMQILWTPSERISLWEYSSERWWGLCYYTKVLCGEIWTPSLAHSEKR